MTNLGESSSSKLSPFSYSFASPPTSCGHTKCVYNKPKMKREYSPLRVQRIFVWEMLCSSKRVRQTNDSILSDLTFWTQKNLFFFNFSPHLCVLSWTLLFRYLNKSWCQNLCMERKGERNVIVKIFLLAAQIFVHFVCAKKKRDWECSPW